MPPSNKRTRPEKQKVTIRFPALVEGLGERLGKALKRLDVRQQELAREMGGYRSETISYLVNGKSSQVAIDLMLRLAEFFCGRGISLPWLFLGMGEMMLEDELAGVGPKIETTDILSYTLLIAMGKKLGLDMQAILRAWNLEMKWPGRGIFTLPLAELVSAVERGLRLDGPAPSHPPLMASGYRTIPAEDMPTDPNWWRTYVPVIGRVAAGDGLDAAEAGQYPPAWAGEFVEYRGGPNTAIAVRVAGESMLPEYSQDDMLIVDTARQGESGKVCCLLIAVDGFREARVKRMIHRGRNVILESLNPAWAPEKLPADKIIAAYSIIAHLPRIPR